MPTRATELGDVRRAKDSDPHCALCHPTPKGHVRADQVWAAATSGTGPAFRVAHPDGFTVVTLDSGQATG